MPWKDVSEKLQKRSKKNQAIHDDDGNVHRNLLTLLIYKTSFSFSRNIFHFSLFLHAINSIQHI